MTKKILQPGLVRAFRDASDSVDRVKTRRYGPEFMSLVAIREEAWTKLVRSNDRAAYMACRTQRAFQSLPV